MELGSHKTLVCYLAGPQKKPPHRQQQRCRVNDGQRGLYFGVLLHVFEPKALVLDLPPTKDFPYGFVNDPRIAIDLLSKFQPVLQVFLNEPMHLPECNLSG